MYVSKKSNCASRDCAGLAAPAAAKLRVSSFLLILHYVVAHRYVILHKDFEKAYKSTIKKQTDEFEFYK